MASGGACVTIVAVSHSWDETKQMLRELKKTALSRQGTQRIARSIMVQRSKVYAAAIVEEPSGRRTEFTRAESWLVPSLELFGKSAEFVLAGLRKGCCFPLFDTGRAKTLADKVDCIVLTLWGDAASSNRRALRLLVAWTIANNGPSQVVMDVGQVCLLHQLHWVKVQLVDVHNQVSLMYCLSRLVNVGSVLHVLADHIGGFVEEKCKRVVRPPPPEAVARTRAVMNTIFKLGSSHHLLFGKKGTTSSRLVQDVEAILRLDNGGFAGACADDPLVHYCWDGKGACCANRQESVDKIVAAYLNLLVAHAMPVGTLSRWTHVQTICSMLCAGFACRDIFVQGLLRGLKADQDAESLAAQKLAVGASGAGDEDVATEHRARIAKVVGWLGRDDTRFAVASFFAALRIQDSLTYYLMGGERPGQGKHRQPGALRPTEEPLPMKELVGRVRTALSQLASLLQDLEDEGSECREFFRGVGVPERTIESESAIRSFRRLVVGSSVGIYRRLALRLNSFPLHLWWLTETDVVEEDRQTCAKEFLTLEQCCLGIFGQGLRRVCPTVEELLSAKGFGIIRVWLRSLPWSVYGCERSTPHAADCAPGQAGAQLVLGRPRTHHGVGQDDPCRALRRRPGAGAALPRTQTGTR